MSAVRLSGDQFRVYLVSRLMLAGIDSSLHDAYLVTTRVGLFVVSVLIVLTKKAALVGGLGDIAEKFDRARDRNSQTLKHVQ